MGLLDGKNAMVTGAHRGIGHAIVQRFCEEGCSVWACARVQDDDFEQWTQQLSNEYGVRVTPLYFDVTDEEEIKVAVRAISKSHMPVDILVNNAGIIYNALVQMASLKEIRKLMEVNFFGPYVITQLVTRLMVRNNRGSVINIASVVGLDGNGGQSGYAATKAALIAMTKATAYELGAKGIRANCIAPGLTRTDMGIASGERVIKLIENETALGRIGEPEEVANAAVFLASDLSEYITGQVLRVDGALERGRTSR